MQRASPASGQVYDIVFEARKLEGARLVKPAYAKAFLNGIVLHNRKEIIGRMAHKVVGTYEAHGPLPEYPGWRLHGYEIISNVRK